MLSLQRSSGQACGDGGGPRSRLLAAVGALLALGVGITPAPAQPIPQALLAPGNAAVTGFSGAISPVQLPPGVHPAERTFIDLDGPSTRIVDLQNMRGMPNAQFVNAPKPYTVTAAQVGQVFAVALDNNTPPSIFVAASSAYGIPIVAPGPDGAPRHLRRGVANARFMPGLWGQAAPAGGPGSIWRIDGVTGAVSLFANVTLNGMPNSGPALGGLAFDADTNSLFVADRDTGMIHRFDMTGTELRRYDHGVQGRRAEGLLPVPFDRRKRLDIRSAQFDSEQPATWAYAPPERRVFGLGIHRGRLYYAVAAGQQIWSVGLRADGSFGDDATIEINVPPGSGPTEISKITFDDQGRMYLAERPAPTGAFDFNALTPEGIGRVLRYAIVESHPGAPRAWQPSPDEYAIGFPGELRNGNGGVAIGYDYDRRGVIDRGACGSFLWSTGERLRETADGTSAARLSLSLPHDVDGLQGNFIWLVRPHNVPPFKTYFVDYDDRFDEAATRGHMGDIAIWRICGPLLRGGWMLPGWMAGWVWWGPGTSLQPAPPALDCPPDQQKAGFQCCPKGTSPAAGGQCKPWCPSGAMDEKSQQLCGLGFDAATYDPNDLGKLLCIGGSAADPGKGNLACVPYSPVLNPPVCQVGWSKQSVPNVGTICQPTQQQTMCGPAQQVSPIDNQCHTLCVGTAWPALQCCAPGSVMSSTGKCCPPGSTPDPKTGQCQTQTSACPPTQVSSDGKCCDAGWTPNGVSGGCCPPGQSPAAGTGVCQPSACAAPNKQIGAQCCSPAELAPGGACATLACGPGKAPVGAGNFCCDSNKVYTAQDGAQACCLAGIVSNGQCQSQIGGGQPGGGPAGGGAVGGGLPGGGQSGGGSAGGASGEGPPGGTPVGAGCSAGYAAMPDGSCCQSGQLTSGGVCCPAGLSPAGPDKNQCQPIKVGWGDGPGASGGSGSAGGGQCCASGLIPVAGGGCCAPAQVTPVGACCPAGQTPDPKNPLACAPVQLCLGRETLVDGACCANTKVFKDAKGSPQCCANDVTENGICPSCLPGFKQVADGTCCVGHLVSADGKTCQPFLPPKPPPPQQAVPAQPALPKATPAVPAVISKGATPATPTCPAGQKPDAKSPDGCSPLLCSARETLVDGACCANSKVFKDAKGSAQCCANDVTANGICPRCLPGWKQVADGTCCVGHLVSADGKTCKPSLPPSPPPPRQAVPALPALPKTTPAVPKAIPTTPAFPKVTTTPARPQTPGYVAKPKLIETRPKGIELRPTQLPSINKSARPIPTLKAPQKTCSVVRGQTICR